MNEEMKNMKEAFDDFDKACETAINACQDFIDMDINEKQENKKPAALEVPVGELPPVRPVTNNLPNYDEMWGVSGYYNDNDGNDIRDRD